MERLKGPLRGVAAGASDYQEVVLAAVNRRCRKIGCRITITPLLDHRDERSGAILVMEERKGAGQDELPDGGGEGR
ncbi:MAG: hypothetical protein AB1578_22710 [Thermodesulfobacteriota bacterium]